MRDRVIDILWLGLIISVYLFGLSAIANLAHAEWIVSECSAYTPYDCGTITATGEPVHIGGVACNFLPFGTVIVIDGKEYVVNDRCGIDNCIDIFMEDYDAATQFGRRNKEVYVKR